MASAVLPPAPLVQKKLFFLRRCIPMKEKKNTMKMWMYVVFMMCVVGVCVLSEAVRCEATEEEVEVEAAVVDALREEVASLRQLSTKYADEVETLEAKASECSHERRALEKELASIKSQDADTLSEKVKQAKALEEQLGVKTAELQELQKRAAQTEAEKDAKLAEKDAKLAEQSKQSVAKFAEQSKQSADQLAAVVTAAEDAAADAAKEAAAKLDAVMTEAETKVAAAKKDAAEKLDAANKDAAEKLDAAKKDAAEKLDAAKAAAERTAAIAASEKDALLAETAGLRLEVEELTKKLAGLQAENAACLKAKTILEQDQKKLTGELSDAMRKVAILDELEKTYGVRVERFIRKKITQTKELAEGGYASATELASRCYNDAMEKFPVVQAHVMNATLSMNGHVSASAGKMYNATLDMCSAAAAHSETLYQSIKTNAIPYVDKLKTSFTETAATLSSSSILESVNMTHAVDYVRTSVSLFNASAATTYLRDLRIGETIGELQLGETFASAYETASAAGVWAANQTSHITSEIIASDTTKHITKEIVLYTMLLRNIVGDSLRAYPQTAPYAEFDMAVTLFLMCLCVSVLLYLMLSLLRLCCGARRTARGRAGGMQSSPNDESSATTTRNNNGTIRVPQSPTDSVGTKKSGRRQTKRM